MDVLGHLKSHLKGKVLVIGIGNTMRCDDGAGSLFARFLQDKTPFTAWDTGVSPENYLGKIIKDNPDVILFIDAVDFGGKPGEFRLLETDELKTANFFVTHNASLSLAINFLQENLRSDMLCLVIQPKCIAFGDKLSPEVEQNLNKLEEWFIREFKGKGCRGF